MSDEEYEREKADIVVHLEVLIELLQRNEEYQRCGFLMRRKIRWHKLRNRKEKLMKAQWEDEIFKASEYQEE